MCLETILGQIGLNGNINPEYDILTKLKLIIIFLRIYSYLYSNYYYILTNSSKLKIDSESKNWKRNFNDVLPKLNKVRALLRLFGTFHNKLLDLFVL